MGALGCCVRKPRTVQNQDITDSKQASHVAPPGTSAYQVDYIPPTNVNMVVAHQPEIGAVNNLVPISPASQEGLMIGSNYNLVDANRKIKVNDASVSIGDNKEVEIGITNAFR